jgi:hypothetical protein
VFSTVAVALLRTGATLREIYSSPLTSTLRNTSFPKISFTGPAGLERIYWMVARNPGFECRSSSRIFRGQLQDGTARCSKPSPLAFCERFRRC